MAERTGEREIDDLIRAFMRKPEIAKLRDSRVSAGRCGEISRAFRDFVTANAGGAIEAHYSSGTPDELGYHDRLIRGFATHAVTLVTGKHAEYMIDFTATQYGYREHPMVQRRHIVLGKWQRWWKETRAGQLSGTGS